MKGNRDKNMSKEKKPALVEVDQAAINKILKRAVTLWKTSLFLTHEIDQDCSGRFRGG